MRNLINIFVLLVFVLGGFSDASKLQMACDCVSSGCLAPFFSEEVDSYKELENICLSIYSQNEPNSLFHRDHALRVARFSRLMCKEAGIDEETTFRVYRAALLHDAGQMGEDLEFREVILKFAAAQGFKKEITHNRGVYSLEHFEQELNRIATLIVDKGLLEKHPNAVVRFYNIDGSLDEEHILNQDNAVELIERHLVRMVAPAAPFYTSLYVKEQGFEITDLEKALIIYHHTLPQYITRENMSKTFPHLKGKEMDTFLVKVRRLLGIVKTADTLEASSSRFRGRNFYGREKETLSDLYKYMEMRFQKGDVSPEAYSITSAMLLNKNPAFVRTLLDCREASEFWPEDEVFLLELRARAMSALCDYSA